MMAQTLLYLSCTLRNVSQFPRHSNGGLTNVIDRDAMDYFRALAATEERSERVLELTETIIRMNPAHYTVW